MTDSDWETQIRLVFPNWHSSTATAAWPTIRASLSVGQTVQGKVIARAHFGVWLDIGIQQPAVLLVVNMAGDCDQPISLDDYPQIGEVLSARINALGDNGEIGLTQQYPDSMIEGEPAK